VFQRVEHTSIGTNLKVDSYSQENVYQFLARLPIPRPPVIVLMSQSNKHCSSRIAQVWQSQFCFSESTESTHTGMLCFP
jgi:hypothetical protein